MKYINLHHAHHIVNNLQKYYKLSIDRERKSTVDLL